MAITDAKGGTKKIAYRPDGLLQSYTDCSGSSTVWDYDPRGRTISITDALGNVTQYRYSAHGPLESIIAPDGASTALTHDAESRLLKLTDPLGRSTHYSYDKAGRLAQRTDANGHSLGYRYDRLGRLVSLINENHRAYQFEYDRVGRLLAETGFDGNTTRYQYDPAGRLAVQLEGETRTDYRYDRAGRLVERSTASGKETFGYDPAGRLSTQQLEGATRWQRQYHYDAAGQLTQIADSHAGSLSYRYDPVGRLLEAVTPRGQERFQFDPAGNLLDPNPPAQAPANLLSNLLADYAGRHYRYDDRGNLLEKRHNGQRTAFEWDAFNRLRRLTRPDGAQVEYHYDPLGRRLAKVGAEGVVFYGWDGDTLAFETRSTGAIHYLFEPASFTPLAQVHTAPIEGLRVPAWGAHIPYDPEADPLRAPPPAPEPPRAIFYYHTDHLGTPQLLTDAAGQQALEMEYQAWGAAREILTQAAQSAGLRNPLRFQGQYHDDESGLHYNRYRYYDPDTGRFISRDPIGLLGGMNVHAYAPNPVEWVDPLGLAKRVGCPGKYHSRNR